MTLRNCLFGGELARGKRASIGSISGFGRERESCCSSSSASTLLAALESEPIPSSTSKLLSSNASESPPRKSINLSASVGSLFTVDTTPATVLVDAVVVGGVVPPQFIVSASHGAVIIASLLPVSDWKNVPKRFRPSRSDIRCAISGVSSCRLVKFSCSTGAFALRMNVIGYFFMWMSRTYFTSAGLSCGTPIRS
uniref:Uncharacterized protein n=1 Tax=Anopheles farauti TaxID=69004 RepID=A0A182QJ48_9DIPT